MGPRFIRPRLVVTFDIAGDWRVGERKASVVESFRCSRRSEMIEICPGELQKPTPGDLHSIPYYPSV